MQSDPSAAASDVVQVAPQNKRIDQISETILQISAAISQATNEQEILAALGTFSEANGVALASLSYITVNENNYPYAINVAAVQTGSGQTVPLEKLPAVFHLRSEARLIDMALSNPDELLFIEDVFTDPRCTYGSIREQMQVMGQSALIQVVLKTGNTWHALVSFAWAEPQQFSPELRVLLTSMRPILISVVANRRTLFEAETMRRRAETLALVNASLSQATNEDEILVALAPLTERLKVETATLTYWVMDENGDPYAGEVVALRTGDGRALPVTSLPTTFFLRSEVPVLELAYLYPDEPSFFEDIATDPRQQSESMVQYRASAGVGAVISVTLKIGNQWHGVLGYRWRTPQVFPQETRELFRQIRATLVSVVASRRAYLAQERALREAEAAKAEIDILYNASSKLAHTATPVELLDTVSDYARRQGAVSAALFYTDNDSAGQPEWLEVVASWADETSTRLQPGRRFYVPDFPLSRLWLDKQEAPVLIDDMLRPGAVDDGSRQFAERVGLRADAILPLTVKGRSIGLLQFTWNQVHPFRGQDYRLLAALQQQAAPVADSLRLFEETRKRAEQAELLSRINAALSQAADESAILEAVALFGDPLGAVRSVLAYIDTDNGLPLATKAVAIREDKTIRAANQSYYTGETPVLRLVYERPDEPIVIDRSFTEWQYEHSPIVPDLITVSKTEPVVLMALKTGDEWHGILIISGQEARQWTPENLAMIKAIQPTVASAVARRRLDLQILENIEHLREMDKLKTEFMSSMSHELRTPLNAIIGLTDIILAGLDGDINARVESDIRTVFNSGQHLLSIVNDVLDIAKIEAGRLDLIRNSLDMRRTINEAFETARVMADAKKLNLVSTMPENLPIIQADRTRMRQIILNLLSNAIKFTEQGTVEISVQAQDTSLVVCVRDEGIGIKPEHQSLIFESFRQVEGAITRKKGGTGLGLPISKRLIELHGGRIWLESQWGQGSKFYFSLPLTMEDNR